MLWSAVVYAGVTIGERYSRTLKENEEDHSIVSPSLLKAVLKAAKNVHVATSLLTSCNRLVVNTLISACVLMACDSLLKIRDRFKSHSLATTRYKKPISGSVRMTCDSLLTINLLQVVNRLVAR